MALKPLTFQGGMDVMSPATMRAPGSLQACKNYEWNTVFGYTRVAGAERTDGAAITQNEGVGQFKFVRLYMQTDNSSAGVNVGTFPANRIRVVNAGVTTTLLGYALGSAVDTGPVVGSSVGFYYNMIVTPESTILNTGFNTLHIANADGVDESTSSIYNVSMVSLSVDDIDGAAEDLNDAIAAFATIQRTAITTIPGQAGSDILGGFWLKDRPYALRDLQRVYFDTGLYSDANEGQFFTIGASEYEVLAVTHLSGDSGFLTLDPVAGSGTDVTGSISSPAALSITGSPPNCDVGADYNESSSGYTSLALVGGTATVWSVVDDPFVERLRLDADSPGLLGQQTNAALWKADSAGWTRVDLGREMQFSDGTSAIVNFVREHNLDGATAKSVGHSFATTSTLNGAAAANLNADDAATVALSGASGDTFIAKTFAAFSAIPSTAIIRGIEVKIDRTSSAGNEAKDNTVTLVGLTGGVENKARGGAWPTSLTVATYGGANDLWGNQSITPADLQASSFGVLLVADRLNSGTAATGSVDYISVKVYYVERETPAYVWNGTTDVEISIRHIQVLGGEESSGTAYGYMSITASKNAAKSRLINVGDTIRTAASGGGNLIATVASRDVPIFYPGQADLDNNGSQYRTRVDNFFASDGLDAAYTVCGVGPCIYFDGSRTIRIRTDLPAGEDNPRHVERLGEKLVLGMYGGGMHRSRPNNPFELRTSEGAGFTPFGDRMSGLRLRSSDELVVPCQSTIQAWTGSTEAAGLRSVITRERGMIEYTDANMGEVLGCDGQGVFRLVQPPTLGPAEQDYLSANIAAWLEPRLQATDNAGQYAIGPICAHGFRHKRQYRLYFEDGWFLSLAMTSPPTPMLGRYEDANGDPLPLRCIFSGIDSRGRERTFASFRGRKEGYLFELDVGRSFDGDAIAAYAVLNPISKSQGAPSDKGQWNHLTVHGSGYGVATLTVSRSKDYADPDPDNALTLTLGSSTAAASLSPKPFRGSVDHAIEAEELTLRFDSSSASEGPHTLQLTNLFVDDRGFTRGYTGT